MGIFAYLLPRAHSSDNTIVCLETVRITGSYVSISGIFLDYLRRAVCNLTNAYS
jgi:hypothetical protein